MYYYMMPFVVLMMGYLIVFPEHVLKGKPVGRFITALSYLIGILAITIFTMLTIMPELR